MPAVFVHVSDIHFGQEMDDRVHIHDDVKEQLIADAKQVVNSLCGGDAHGILVTGDIAQSGKRVDYEKAADWLDRLAGAINVPISRVQMVPGNHDLDRDKLTDTGKYILAYIRGGGPAELEEILKDQENRAVLFKRFEDYGRFSYGYDCPLNEEGAYATEMEVTLAPGRAIRFIRFNSSLLCHGGERDDNPELLIGSRQFTVPPTPGVENIVLVHHPLSWYKDHAQVRDYVHGRVRVFISGHEHNPNVSIHTPEAECDLMMLAAGATVPYRSNNEYTFTYNVIEFDWDADIDGLSVTIHPRAWNPRFTRFEADENRLGGKDPNFRLACPFFRAAPRPGEAAVPHGESTSEAAAARPAEPVIQMVPVEQLAEEAQQMPPKAIDYEVARLRFFRDLREGERLRILVELDGVPKGLDERLNQNLERRLLDRLVQGGKLGEVEAMIERLIGERKDGVE